MEFQDSPPKNPRPFKSPNPDPNPRRRYTRVRIQVNPLSHANPPFPKKIPNFENSPRDNRWSGNNCPRGLRSRNPPTRKIIRKQKNNSNLGGFYQEVEPYFGTKKLNHNSFPTRESKNTNNLAPDQNYRPSFPTRKSKKKNVKTLPTVISHSWIKTQK